MADRTPIEWADATWNPNTGCSRVTEGCRNCYAEIMAARFSKPGQWGEGLAQIVRKPDGSADHRWTGQVRFNERVLDQPLRWRKPRRIFVCSTSDLFHEGVPDEWLDKVFAVMALAPHHTFMVLTKRPERAREYITSGPVCDIGQWAYSMLPAQADPALYLSAFGDPEEPNIAPKSWPLPNVWIGTSIEDQATADARIPHLLATPAAVRFVSAEPLLGPVDLEVAWHGESALEGECWGDCAWCDKGYPPLHNCQRGRQAAADFDKGRDGLDLVIVGGESGPGARPMHPDWPRALRDQCLAAGTAFFFKQWGEWRPRRQAEPGDILNANRSVIMMPDGRITSGLMPYGPDAWVMDKIGKKAAGRLLDGKVWDQMPGGGA